MIAKKATTLATTLGKGLNQAALLVEVAKLNLSAPDADSVINAYRQIQWDGEDDLIGKPTPLVDAIAGPAPKATKKATKKSAAKPAAKKAVKKAAAKKSADVKEPTVKKPGTDAKLRELILAGKTNEQALAATLKAFPKAKTSMACASWNRSQLRNHGEKYGLTKAQMAKVPTNKEAGEKK